jgi:cytochrome c oxidase subunit II
LETCVYVRHIVRGARTAIPAGVWFTTAPSTSIFSGPSTPAHEIHLLSIFVLTVTGVIFIGMSCLLSYALVRFRSRPADTVEPPQVFGSIQIELAWTIIPILIIVVLFLGTVRVLFSIQDAHKPEAALDVTVVGHQFWWEFRYPKYNIVTANELHVPLSSASEPRPTFMRLTSADVIHSFWVPQLAGKTDLLPNRVNEMWIDPLQPGLYVGQCAQFCGAQHAKMLLRVYVDPPAQFQRWITEQQKARTEFADVNHDVRPELYPGKRGVDSLTPNSSPTRSGDTTQIPSDSDKINPLNGRLVFEQQTCINCHTVAGTVANGRFGPDLTHLMSRTTLAAGAISNTPENLTAWITDPSQFKPGSLMPAMHLTDRQNAQITAYLLTLK